MLRTKAFSRGAVLAVSASVLALSACSTQGASRYGDTQAHLPPAPCGTAMVPCGHVVEYHAVQVQPPAYLAPLPCPAGQCAPVSEPVIMKEAPAAPPPQIIEPAPYVPPEPYVPPAPERPVSVPRPVVDDPVISCPEGSIPSYGGQDCISLRVGRK